MCGFKFNSFNLNLPDGHAGKQQVSSVQKGESGVTDLVAERDGQDALTCTWGSNSLANSRPNKSFPHIPTQANIK